MMEDFKKIPLQPLDSFLCNVMKEYEKSMILCYLSSDILNDKEDDIFS